LIFGALRVPRRRFIKPRRGETLTTSLAVAAAYGKRHDNVLAKIREILRGLELSRVFLFREAKYIDEEGVTQPMYEMNEEAFSLLVGGFK
jgi:Rha family phage regulatory protein